MKIALLVIGNELLNGKIKDLNTHTLAKTLYEASLALNHVQICGDSPADFLQSLSNAYENHDVIITCGGLGPTQDDLTKNMLADFFKKPLNLNKEALAIVEKQYKRGDRVYDQEKFQYHIIPDDFYAIENNVGYAPALGYTSEKSMVFALPGVPSEFSGILETAVLPKLKAASGNQFIKHVIAKTWKLPESKIFHEYAPEIWEKLEAYGEVSSLPHLMGVDLAVKLIEKSLAELERKEKEIIEIFNNSNLKDYIWQFGPLSIEEVVINEAKAKKLTIGFSESCTGGLCASRITDIDGSSSVFWGSVVSYANEVKMNSLNVSEKTLMDFGAVSEQTAFEMANGAREHLKVDIAVSTTGIAGPGGGSIEKPVGTVGIGISTKHETKAKMYHFKGNREMLKKRFSDKALMTMLEAIRKF